MEVALRAGVRWKSLPAEVSLCHLQKAPAHPLGLVVSAGKRSPVVEFSRGWKEEEAGAEGFSSWRSQGSVR